MIHVGVAGWSYADWEGRVHPRPKPRGHHPLDDFGAVFGCVEVNASFYRDLDPEVVGRWLDRLGGATPLRFTVKLHRDFTHGREEVFATPRLLEAGLERFRRSIAPLVGHPRLGAVLLQFPLSFRRTARHGRYLAALVEATADLRPVVEVRHRSWFERGVLDELLGRGASIATIDLPTSKDHPPEDYPGEGPVGYLRLHGRNAAAWFDPRSGRDQQYDYRYTRAELEPLAQRAMRLDAQADATYTVTNNHFAGSAVADAVVLLDLVGSPPSSLPARWIETFPELGAIAAAHGQQRLFP